MTPSQRMTAKQIENISKKLGRDRERKRMEALEKEAYTPNKKYTANRATRVDGLRIDVDKKLRRNKGLNKRYSKVRTPKVNFANLSSTKRNNESLRINR